jgi:hypothetical protein
LENSCIYELLYNATIEGKGNYTNYDDVDVNFSNPDQMGSLILRRWGGNIIQLANRSGFNITIYRDNIGVYQSDPWNVKIGYNMHFNVSDRALDSVFRKDMVPVLVTIPITNYTYGG